MSIAKQRLQRLLQVWGKIKSLQMRDSYREMKRCDVILCCADGDRTETYEGLAYSRVADSFAEELGRKGVVVQSFAWPYSRQVGSRAWGAVHSANRFFFANALKDIGCRLVGWKLSGESRAVEFYSRLMQQTGAKSIVGIGLPQAALKAAKINCLKSIELLHGYGYTSVPWGWDSALVESLPDVVVAFDELSAETFRTLAARGIRVFRAENFWYRKFCTDEASERMPHSWRSDQEWIPKGKKIILISLSWGYDGDHGVYTFFSGILGNGLFPEELVDAIKIAGDEYYWVIRLHPVQLSGERMGHYKKVLNDLCRRLGNCEWVMGSKVPLPLLLRHCHAHITMMSMTAYDAAFMGVRSLLLCPTLKPGGANELMFSDLKKQGYAELGSFDALKIVGWLRSIDRTAVQFSVEAPGGLSDPKELVL